MAEALQLAIEYDAQPPFDSGSPANASASTLRLAVKLLLGDRPFRRAADLNRQTAGAWFGRLTRRG